MIRRFGAAERKPRPVFKITGVSRTSTCGACGRIGLEKTIEMYGDVEDPEWKTVDKRTVYYGVDCAARAFGVREDAVLRAAERIQAEKMKGIREHQRRARAQLGIPEPVIDAFVALGDAQRGEPEMAMERAQHALGGGVLSFAIEHTGDLTNRMTKELGWGRPDAGYEYVSDKVQKVLRALRNKYGFRREHVGNLESNATYFEREKKMTPAAYRERVTEALDAYAKAHTALPVYNDAQWFAREAAVRLGKNDFEGAERALSVLERHLESPEAWGAYATQFQLDSSGRPKPHDK